MLSSLSHLTEIELKSCRKVKGSIESLSGLAELQHLGLARVACTGDIKALSRLSSLRYINFNGNDKLRGDILSFKNLTNLRELWLSGCSGVLVRKEVHRKVILPPGCKEYAVGCRTMPTVGDIELVLPSPAATGSRELSAE